MHRAFPASTARRVRYAAAATLAIASTAATAQTVTLPFAPASTYRSSIELRGYPGDGSCLNIYTVAAPYKLRITDAILDSYGSTTPLPFQYICSGKPNCTVARSAYITAPAGNTLVQNFTTGTLITTGDTLSVCNYSGSGRTVSWTFHGYLYTTP